jgi:hypothetical protein
VTKRGRDEPEQLSLDFAAPSGNSRKHNVQPVARPNIVGFVDAGTVALRREAIRRVKSSGIFAVPDGLTRLKG